MNRTIVAVVCVLLALCLLAGCGPNRVEKAEKLWKAGANSEASQLLTDEIKDHPDNAQAFIVFGKILYKTDGASAKEKFKSAIKVDKEAKDQVIDFILKNITSRSDMDFLNELEKGYVNGDIELCYKYHVSMAPDYASACEFADRYRDDKRAPAALLGQAGWLKQGGSSYAKTVFKSVIKRYPKSNEAKEAKRVLSDWWEKHEEQLPTDSKWHGVSINKGQEYRYEITGEVVLEAPFGGIVRFNGDKTSMFIGTRDELIEMMRYCGSGLSGYGYSGPRSSTAGTSGSGVAPRGGKIWFTIDTGAEFITRGLKLTLEYKDKT